MKKLYICLTILIALTMETMSQESNLNWNLILTIDEELITEGIVSPSLEHRKPDNKLDILEASYIPGNLTISSFPSNISSEDTLKLVFKYEGYGVDNELFQYDYSIEIDKEWLNYSYVIIHIYNLSKDKYKKRYPSHLGKEYVFDLITSNGKRIVMWK